jgi:glucose/arabinose dehydrogenase
VYVANTDSVVRFPYADGDLAARGPAETIIDNISGGGRLRGGGHWTRDVVFSSDGAKMYVSVGSRSNVSDDASEARRARIFAYTLDGKNERVFSTGIRNPVGLAVHPVTHDLWTSVNERDELGDHLVPTTSRACAMVASTAGRGSTCGRTRILATRASIPSCATR